ncbi:MAG: putative metal-binding motif-containing protein, partial [Myxococcota bacterium]
MNNRYMYAVLALVMACGDTNGGDSGGGSDQDSDTDDLVVEDDTGDIVEEPVDDDRDGFSVDEDCDDTNADISPAAQEVCDGIDNDCDGDIDDADDSLDAGDDGVVVYTDADADGFGDPETERRVCVMGDVQVSTAGDCDDRDEDVNPSGEERCDGVDNDCNGEIDEIIFIDE